MSIELASLFHRFLFDFLAFVFHVLGTAKIDISWRQVIEQFMEAYVKVKQPDQVLEMVAEALGYSKKYLGSHWDETEICRLKGELQLLRGDPGAVAEIDFRQAVDSARRQKARSLELRAAICLSLLLGAQRKSEEACQSLSEICGWFNEGAGTRDLIQARGLPKELALG